MTGSTAGSFVETGPLFLRQRWPALTLSAIVLVAFAIRAVDVTDNPRGFFTDEAAAGLDAEAILTTGEDMFGNTLPFFFRSLGDYKLPLFIYAEVPFVAALGLSEFSVRITVVVLGSLTVITTYILARELYRGESGDRFSAELPALAAAALLAVMPWHIHYSRTGFGEMVSLPLMFTLAWYLFLRSLRTGGALLLPAVAFAVCFYTYRAGWVVLPPFLALLMLSHHRELLARRREALIAAAAFAVVLLPLARHLLFGPADRASEAWIFNIESDRSTIALFWDHYSSYFTPSFLFEDGDNGFLLRHFFPGHGELYWFMFPLVLAGLARVIVAQDRRLWPLVALLFLYPLAGALSDMSPISSRAILGSITFALLGGLGLASLIEWAVLFRPRAATYVRAAGVGAALVAVAVSFGAYFDDYMDDYPALASGFWGWQDGPEEITERFLAMQDDYDELYLDSYFNAPEVFFWFYADGACYKCGIGDPEQFRPDKRQLFALRSENPAIPFYKLRVIETLYYPDGTPSFYLVEVEGVY